VSDDEDGLDLQTVKCVLCSARGHLPMNCTSVE
jgi:hypothetical protein